MTCGSGTGSTRGCRAATTSRVSHRHKRAIGLTGGVGQRSTGHKTNMTKITQPLFDFDDQSYGCDQVSVIAEGGNWREEVDVAQARQTDDADTLAVVAVFIEAPAEVFLSWPPAKQFAYCAARDEDAALSEDISLDWKEWYLARADTYRRMSQ